MMITRDYKVTDPEFAQLFEHFVFDEVVSEESAKLDEADPVSYTHLLFHVHKNSKNFRP